MDARGTEGKGKFTSMAVRKYRMVEMRRWKNRTFGQSKILRDVGGGRCRVEFGMPDRILAIFIHPRVERCEIVITNDLTLGDIDLMV